MSECLANAVSRWSKNGTEVSMSRLARAVQVERRSMLDSLVSRVLQVRLSRS